MLVRMRDECRLTMDATCRQVLRVSLTNEQSCDSSNTLLKRLCIVVHGNGMEHIRTFIALQLPDDLVQELYSLQRLLLNKFSGVKWVEPKNMHLTLKFLGATSPDRITSITALLERAVQGFTAFHLAVSGIGAFPNPRNPKVVWAGIQPEQQLIFFQHQLESALAAIGYAREKRSFSPHLTLGRVRDTRARRDVRALIEEHSRTDLGSFTASRVIFFRSDLLPSGPVYSVLKEAVLPS